MNQTSTVTAPRIEWIDVMRAVACFMVVLAHCCDPFVGKLDESPIHFLSGAFWGSMLRPAVPLFVLISGALLLPIKDTTEVFYKKRMSRVLIPFIIWSVLTPLAYFAYGSITLDKALVYIYTFPINFNGPTTPFWYIYMLIGLYLFIPIISPWLEKVGKKGLESYLKIWFITLFLPYVQLLAPYIGYEGNYGSMGILGACFWNEIGTFYYFTGFTGYLLLGHYLAKYPLNWSWKKTLSVGVPLYLAGFAITYLSFISISKNYAALEVVWYFTNINVFMMTIAMFLILKKITITHGFTHKLIKKISYLSFGVYLTHFLVVQMSYDYLNHIPVPPYVQIVIMGVCAFTVTNLFVYLLSKLPKCKYLIG